MLCYKGLVFARLYTKGDKDNIKKQNAEYLHKKKHFFLVNGSYGFIYTLSSILIALLDLVEES